MSETSVEAPVSNSEPLSTPAPIEDTGEASNEPKEPNKEMRYRLALREAEAKIEAMQRADIERVAGEHLAQGSDIFLTSELNEYLGEDGTVDYGTVAEAAKALLAERPRLGKNQPAHDPSQGIGNPPKPKPEEPSWSSLLVNPSINSFGR